MNDYLSMIDDIKPDEYEIIFGKCAKSINEFWNDDVGRYYNEHCRGLQLRINQVEESIEKLWGKAPLPEFRKELVKFYKLHQLAYSEYQKN